MRMHTTSGRSLWPALITAAVVLGALVAFLVTRPSAQATATPTTSPTTTPASTTTTTTTAAPPVDTGAAPTGCLGGSGRNLAMIVATQKKAPHSAYGAVEFAASFYRWVMQYPTPTTDQVAAAAGTAISAAPAANVSNLASAYAERGDHLIDTVPAGTPFFLSTRGGKWLVDESSTNDRVIVHVMAPYVINGTVSTTDALGEGFVVVWENDAWRVQEALKPNTSAVETGGTFFTGGC